ncbi:MAG: biotin--[acetyl-CoA-carboxylase] ligase [Treponema sp.]|nr:biotin--[acetyl-CoA-carboxylase] ligase [Treponema sp.]
MKTREVVFRELSNPHTEDGFISGEELAERCGISRQAVWKIVKILRARGARIEAVTNRGYHLAGTGSLLSEEIVTALIPPELDVHIKVYESIDSTSTEAKRLCTETADVNRLNGTVIIAEQQTAGRGRLGRSFFSPRDSGLYMSIIYAPEKSITSPAVLTASAAVGVCRALEIVYGIDAQIKWVNDVFFRGKKICGILAEGITNFETGGIECAVVGIGINILPGSFPPELAGVAGAVLDNTDADTKRNALAANVVKSVLTIYTGTEGFVPVMKEYRDRSLLTGMPVIVNPVIDQTQKNYTAVVVGVTDDAKLIVKTADGQTRTLESGEVSLHSNSFALR